MTWNPRRLLWISMLLILASPATAKLPAEPSGDAAPGASAWKIKFDESGSIPVIVDGVLYVGSADGAVHALDPATGRIKWRFQTGESLSASTAGPQVTTVPHGTSMADQMSAGLNALAKQKEEGTRRVDMTPAVDNRIVFIGSGDRSFYGIDAATGTKKWSYVAGSGMTSNDTVPAAIVRNGTVYFATEDGLHALDALTGRKKWLFETLQEVPRQKAMPTKRVPERPIVMDGAIVLTAWPFIQGNTPLKSFVYAVDAESGQARWVTGVDGIHITAPATSKGLAFFAVEERPTLLAHVDRVTLYALGAGDGKVKWKVGAEKEWGTRPLLVAGDTIYFSTEKSLSAVEPETGRRLWTFSADEIGTDLQADDRHLYVATHAGSMARPKDTLHALALATGQERWSRELNARVAMVHDGVIYADGERVHAIDAATGKELWSFKGAGRESARLVSGGRLFLTAPTVTYAGTSQVDQGYLRAIDAKTGEHGSEAGR